MDRKVTARKRRNSNRTEIQRQSQNMKQEERLIRTMSNTYHTDLYPQYQDITVLMRQNDGQGNKTERV